MANPDPLEATAAALDETASPAPAPTAPAPTAPPASPKEFSGHATAEGVNSLVGRLIGDPKLPGQVGLGEAAAATYKEHVGDPTLRAHWWLLISVALLVLGLWHRHAAQAASPATAAQFPEPPEDIHG